MVYQTRGYAFGAPATYVLTNQGGGASVYRPRSLPYRIDSHHHPKEHTILYVFRAPGYDLFVLLS
jgi:hypothetical protein